jgi:hypothetical protein
MKDALQQMGQQKAQSLQKLSPAQQEQIQKVICEQITGKLYRPRS